jgi:hypothetical protein
VVAGPEEEGEGAPEFLREDHLVHEAPGRGEAGVQLPVVLRPDLVHPGGEVLVGDLPCSFSFSSWAEKRAMTALSPSITPIRPVGRERMKSGSKPWPAMA